MAAVTARYARAFADVVFEQKLDAQKIEAEVRAMEAAINESPALRHTWDNPAVPTASKYKVLDAIIAVIGGSRVTRNFFALLIERRRITALKQIREQFEAEINERLGIADADVTSVRALGDDEKRALEAQVAKITGKKIRATYSTDKSVLGGSVVKVGSTVYDGSVRGQLERLKQQLIEA
ncbi:MAG: ATP synthase F1 subunit delta [Terriglobales bacterium]